VGQRDRAARRLCICAVAECNPPYIAPVKFGLHIHEGAPVDTILALVDAGKLAGATIINNGDLANRLVGKVPYVVLRKVWTDHDPPTATVNDQAAGYALFKSDRFWRSCYEMADPRVILQYGNEENYFSDGEFYIGLMKAAAANGRKVVIFNDSVGTTEDEHWLSRASALRYAAQHGHYVGMHAYGRIDADYHPLTALDNSDDWRWYGGRWEHLYSLMPDVQPPLILTEVGPGKSQVQREMGIEAWNTDRAEMERRAAALPYLKMYAWWTAGASNPAYGFAGDSIDDWLTSL
jgi:hypothetical protein